MIVLWIWIVAGLALLGATVCAMADSALLALHASGAAAVSDAGLADRERTHRALSMGRVLSYIAAGASIAQALSFDRIEVVPRALATALAAIVACTIAEGFGRSIGYANPPAVHAGLATFARVVAVLLRPAVALGGAIDRTLHKIIPPAVRDLEEREASAEQFREVVTAEADVSSAEEALIHGVFSLGETEVQEIMVPRVDIVGIEVATSWSEVLDRIRSSEHARLPVFRETLDEVVGILYAKDVLP
ncbi:MAG TPA: hypothetical protein VN600_14150, partial [Gemmatimonadaceae bacterium]|nr:hypothetical protein [Gemmatimonadaceae bacterium]